MTADWYAFSSVLCLIWCSFIDCGVQTIIYLIATSRYCFDHKFLADLSTKICNEVPGVNRVLLDITSKPPSTIEWE